MREIDENDPQYVAGRELAKKVCNSLNTLCGEEETIQGFVAQLSREHRTLQRTACDRQPLAVRQAGRGTRVRRAQ